MKILSTFKQHRFLASGLGLPWLGATALGATDVSQIAKDAEQLASEAASQISTDEVAVWVIIGLLVGSLVGALTARRSAGFGVLGNLGLGLLGAFIGGWIAEQVGLDLGLGELVISYNDLVAALFGAILVVALVWLIKARSAMKARAKNRGS